VVDSNFPTSLTNYNNTVAGTSSLSNNDEDVTDDTTTNTTTVTSSSTTSTLTSSSTNLSSSSVSSAFTSSSNGTIITEGTLTFQSPPAPPPPILLSVLNSPRLIIISSNDDEDEMMNIKAKPDGVHVDANANQTYSQQQGTTPPSSGSTNSGGGNHLNNSNNSPNNNNNHLHRSSCTSPASTISVSSPANITSNGHANGIVEEFPSLEELGNTISDNASFPTSFELSGFPPVTETPPPGYMSEEGDTQDQGDVMGKFVPSLLFYTRNPPVILYLPVLTVKSHRHTHNVIHDHIVTVKVHLRGKLKHKSTTFSWRNFRRTFY